MSVWLQGMEQGMGDETWKWTALSDTHLPPYPCSLTWLTLVLTATALEQGELGRIISHCEFMQQGPDDFTCRVHAANVERVYCTSGQIEGLLLLGAPTRPGHFSTTHSNGPPQLQLDLDESSVHTIWILKKRQDHVRSNFRASFLIQARETGTNASNVINDNAVKIEL